MVSLIETLVSLLHFFKKSEFSFKKHFSFEIASKSEPSLRGVLMTYTNLGTSLGTFMVNLLNTLVPWRMVGLICMFVPLVTIVALYFVSFFEIFKKNS